MKYSRTSFLLRDEFQSSFRRPLALAGAIVHR